MRIRVIKKGELRQSMVLSGKLAQNENTRQIERNWLQVAKANIQAQKDNDRVLRFALFGR